MAEPSRTKTRNAFSDWGAACFFTRAEKQAAPQTAKPKELLQHAPLWRVQERKAPDVTDFYLARRLLVFKSRSDSCFGRLLTPTAEILVPLFRRVLPLRPRHDSQSRRVAKELAAPPHGARNPLPRNGDRRSPPWVECIVRARIARVEAPSCRRSPLRLSIAPRGRQDGLPGSDRVPHRPGEACDSEARGCQPQDSKGCGST